MICSFYLSFLSSLTPPITAYSSHNPLYRNTPTLPHPFFFLRNSPLSFVIQASVIYVNLPLAENCNYFALSSTWFFYFYLLAFVLRSRMYKIYVTSRSFPNSKHAQNYMDNLYLFHVWRERDKIVCAFTSLFYRIKILFCIKSLAFS